MIISFPKKEEEILEFWEQNQIFQKSLLKPSPQGNFVFYEGPPTANGKPALHHVLARAFKDVIPRFKTMQGYKVLRRGGWDTHGLPVELQIEKQLGITRKQQIESLRATPFESIQYFNALCRKSVWEYKEEWEKLTQRMGFWLDLSDAYITCTNEYIESLWWILWQAWSAKDSEGNALLFQGHKVVPFCTRCGTALSSHELAQGYKSVKDTSVYVRFPLRGEQNTFFLSWTTTPWTLPGNVALAVGSDMRYVKVQQGDEYLILSKNRLGILEGEYKVVEEYTGKELIGKKYDPLFHIPTFEQYEKNTRGKIYEVVTADFVTDQDGSGIVHTAVMYGEDDYTLGERLKLPKHHTVLENGIFTDEVSVAAGMHVKSLEALKALLTYLKEKKHIYKKEQYVHDYPFCWRCDSPLIYYARNSWFIRMSALRESMKAHNNSIHWIPDHVKHGRFGEWLEGAKDWALSRERYWGTPLPIWKCENTQCGHIQFLDGNNNLAEAREKVRAELTKHQQPFDYHRPFIDLVTFPCVKCGGETRRVPEVIDVWFDSGGMPFAQWHYPFENKKLIDEGMQYPADYIAEAIDQTRGWFYTLLAISTVLKSAKVIHSGVAYKNVISLGHILDKHGKKMSKSKGNVINPWDIMNVYGVDALRFHLYTMSQPGEPKRFDSEDVKKVVQKYWLILWNVVRFYEMFGQEDQRMTHNGQTKSKKTVSESNTLSEGSAVILQSKDVLDRWLITQLNTLIIQVTKRLENYEVTGPARSIGEFITELSTWYIRRSRARFKSNEPEIQREAVETLKYTLETLAKLMAPFTPFIAEALHHTVTTKKTSVHLESWPQSFDHDAESVRIVNEMETVRQLVEIGLAQREKAGIRLRQPLTKAVITKKLGKEFLDILAEELNVECIEISKELPHSSHRALAVQKEGTTSQQTLLWLDTELTTELLERGMFRELIRQINIARKSANLSIKDHIRIEYHTNDEKLKGVIQKHSTELMHHTLSMAWQEIEKTEAINTISSCKINSATLYFLFKK